MDAISAVAFDLAPAASLRTGGADLAGGGGSAAGPSVFNVAQFQAAYNHAAQPAASSAPEVSASERNGFRTVMATLDQLNGRAVVMGADAQNLQNHSSEMKPGDMLMLTIKAHEFLFHCELTSNVANRTSEGVQQLFREQS